MPFLNFDSRHFSAAEKTAIQEALAVVETALAPKLANLNPQERQQYGSVNEQNKGIINKVKDYRETQPNLSSPDVDWNEYLQDHDSRAFLQNQAERLTELVRGMENAKILHDWDNFLTAQAPQKPITLQMTFKNNNLRSKTPKMSNTTSFLGYTNQKQP